MTSNNSNIHHVVITSDEVGQRLDSVLSARFDDISRGRIQQLLKMGHVTCLKQDLNIQAKMKVLEGQEFDIMIPPAVDATPNAENITLDILYEDKDIIVINKPAGLVVHPGAGNETGTLVNALMYHCKGSLSGIGGVSRPGIVHRLDKDTSGVMVVAKNDIAHQHLSAQFADHGRSGELVRKYQAIVWGGTPRAEGSIVAAIDRHRHNRLKMAVTKNGGREAITHYRLMDSLRSTDGTNERLISQVVCQLETGRTHQIRVHMEYLNCPVLGDTLYGAAFRTRVNRLPEMFQDVVSQLTRQMLHAYHLTFLHPITHKVMTFETMPPEDYQELVRMANFDNMVT